MAVDYKLPKDREGFVYILSNTFAENVIKIGVAEDIDKRITALTRQTASFGDYKVLCKFKVPDRFLIEKALHYKFREFSIGREYFKIDPSEAKKIASKLISQIEPIKNKKAKALMRKASGYQQKSASKKEHWKLILKENPNNFIKEAVKLLLKEGKLGQPEYGRFSGFRNTAQTGIGRFDLFICKNHLRIVIQTEVPHKAKRELNQAFGKKLKYLPWEQGVSLFITNNKDFSIFQRHFHLGQKVKG
jgi:hypothetical protein